MHTDPKKAWKILKWLLIIIAAWAVASTVLRVPFFGGLVAAPAGGSAGSDEGVSVGTSGTNFYGTDELNESNTFQFGKTPQN